MDPELKLLENEYNWKVSAGLEEPRPTFKRPILIHVTIPDDDNVNVLVFKASCETIPTFPHPLEIELDISHFDQLKGETYGVLLDNGVLCREWKGTLDDLLHVAEEAIVDEQYWSRPRLRGDACELYFEWRF